MPRKRPTIADVAEAAEVSIGTVSNYLNGTAGVRPATRARIEKAIRLLTYRRSTFARSLPGQPTKTPQRVDGLPHLLVVGHICVDYLCGVDVLPHRDDRTAARQIEKMLGGPAANLAVAAAGVGDKYALRVDLATAVGEDEDSEWALAELASRGVDTLPIRQLSNNRLPRAIVIVESNGSRTILHETFELSEVDLTENLSTSPQTRKCCLHIEGFHYERVGHSIERFREAGWKISLHTAGLPKGSRNPEAFANLLRRVDLVFINDETLREIFGFGMPMAAMTTQAHSVLSRIKGRGDVVLTLGEFGAIVFRKSGSQIQVPALSVDRLDATGAGDAFAGVFLSLWLHGATLSDAARHAAVAGSLATTAFGAQSHTADLAELEGLLPSIEVRNAG